VLGDDPVFVIDLVPRRIAALVRDKHGE